MSVAGPFLAGVTRLVALRLPSTASDRGQDEPQPVSRLPLGGGLNSQMAGETIGQHEEHKIVLLSDEWRGPSSPAEDAHTCVLVNIDDDLRDSRCSELLISIFPSKSVHH